jgi:hypothetical protein
VLNERLANGIIALVSLVWATNFIAGLLVTDYKPDQAINAIFMAIVGGTFALKGRGGGGGTGTGGRHGKP